MTIKTRDRIIIAARQMFNELGYGNVTTAALAAKVGIAEGNLWYHFNNKSALLHAITENFNDHITHRLSFRPSQAADADIIGEYLNLLNHYETELREYRFLYRDQVDFNDHSNAMLDRLPEFYRATKDQLKQFYVGMIAASILDWADDRIDDLTVNATIIIRFALEYQRENGQPVDAGSGAVRRVFAQHLTLFEHRLVPQAAQRLRAAFS
jgi:AcrR family transcriptional regulator